VTVRGRMTKWFTGQAQYALSRADNDTNGIGWFPANDYDLSGGNTRVPTLIGAIDLCCSDGSFRDRSPISARA